MASQELFALAEELEAAGAVPDLKASQKALDTLEAVADGVKRSFSGSWMGYHSHVYYADLEPTPPGAHFSQEWGMRDMYGSSLGSTGDWREFDAEEIKSHIRKRAKNPNLAKVVKASEKCAKIFHKCKSEIISILSTELDGRPDVFLEKLKAEIEQIEPLSMFDVAQRWAPKGQVIIRDMVALNQGVKIPPHIEIKAEVAAIALTFRACVTVADKCKKAASHLERQSRKIRREARVGTNIFIGHGRSQAWREVKDFVAERLQLPWDEFNRVPVAGVTNIARLSEMLDAAAIALVIMTAEDELADGKTQARMNVIHEVGLFQGRLGFTKAIVLVEDGCSEFSNIHGLGQVRFPKGKISAAFEEIRMVLEREGVLSQADHA